ncbi:MAG: response regulator [Treponema sp.]|jgi:signal transduction histidine kinase/CheY-like chemotaxis protein|nr:response regulator [Treponema sp.]
MLRRLRVSFFDSALPFRARLFNILAIGALLISLFVCIYGLAMGMALANSLACAVIAVLTALLLFVGSKTRRYQLCYFVCIVIVFFGLYPVVFFAAGGYQSGMPSFFVFAVVFTVSMLEGWKALVISLLEIVYYAALCLYAYYNPELVIFFPTEAAYLMDVLIGMVCVSLCLGTTLFFQLRLYNRQQKKLEETSRNLEEQTRLAESASRAKTDFLAQMSHEIRTPMNAIIGMTHLILREEMSPQARDYLESIRRAGDNLLSIINDILDFSRIESGRLNIVPGEYQLVSLINDVLSIIRTRLHEKPVSMFTIIDSTLPRQLLGDEARIRQILLNFLSNAVKYTRQGHIILSVRGKKDDSGNGIVMCFAVTDTGIGIKPEDMEKLFGNFVRVDAKQNRGIEGTGLGLTITRKLCQLMGGDITVRSVYGVGSTFTVSLPQTIVDAGPLARVEAPETKPSLIYEKRRVSGESLVYTLENLGVSCSLVDNREALAELLEKENYRFVFTPSSLYAEFRDMLERRISSGESAPPSDGITPVLFAEYGEAIRTDIKTLIMPIHPAMVAGILNGRTSDSACNHVQEFGVRFTAPDARVLLVDDMVTNLDVTAGLLAPYKVKIDRVPGGVEAIQMIQKNYYDIVFMDHMMPGMDGIEATEIIRKLEGDYFRELPVIALTANAVSGMKEMFLEKGFNDYLPKPMEIARLDDLLGKWIPDEKKIKETSGEKPDAENPLRDGSGLSGETRTPPSPDGGLAGGLSPVEGLDIARGLANTGGAEEGYRRVLSSFVWDAEDRLKHINTLPDSGKDGLAAFTVHVHALKGAAGSIGAAELSADAARLEAAGRNGDVEVIREQLPSFCERLSVLAGKIGEMLAKNGEQGADDGPEGNSGDAPALWEKAGPLREALESLDTTGIERLIAEMERLAGNPKTRQTIARLSHQVLVGEYDEAVETLDGLLEAR